MNGAPGMGDDSGCLGWLIVGLVIGVVLGLVLRDILAQRSQAQSSFEKILFERDEQGRIVGFTKVNA